MEWLKRVQGQCTVDRAGDLEQPGDVQQGSRRLLRDGRDRGSSHSTNLAAT